MSRNDQEVVEELVETIKEHCPNIVNSDPDGSKVRWFAEAIITERTHGVAAHKRNEHHEVLRKLAAAIARVEELAKNLPDGAKNTFSDCLPEKSIPGNPNEMVAVMEGTLGVNQSRQMELSEFLRDLAQTAQNLEQFLAMNSQKAKRRKTLDYSAMMVYRICMLIWKEEFALASCNGNSTKTDKPTVIAQDHEHDQQGEFTAEVFSTLGITTNITSAAERLAEEGGDEALTYNIEFSSKRPL